VGIEDKDEPHTLVKRCRRFVELVVSIEQVSIALLLAFFQRSGIPASAALRKGAVPQRH
jgi:hypothetical protein